MVLRRSSLNPTAVAAMAATAVAAAPQAGAALVSLQLALRTNLHREAVAATNRANQHQRDGDDQGDQGDDQGDQGDQCGENGGGDGCGAPPPRGGARAPPCRVCRYGRARDGVRGAGDGPPRRRVGCLPNGGRGGRCAQANGRRGGGHRPRRMCSGHGGRGGAVGAARGRGRSSTFWADISRARVSPP